MRKLVRFPVLAASAIAAGAVGLFWNGAVTSVSGFGLVTEAQAVVGRPLTPVSYAGVARRTTRRNVVVGSVYINTLPTACVSVVINGIAYFQCGATYYQPSGGRYVVVYVN